MNPAYAPIALFCYNRLDCLQRTVAALKRNDLAAQSPLIIFSDGAKKDKPGDDEKVAAVRSFIRTVSGFGAVEIHEAPCNQGLAGSIIPGVTAVTERFNKVIVVEDDLLTSPGFLTFMNNALIFYETEDRVAGIQAYLPPAAASIPVPETFFIREVGCWGWATWKRGWEIFEPDAKKLLHEIESQNGEYDFNVFGSYTFMQMLREQAAGKIDSWAIRWYASVFLRDKLGLQPGVNLVSNIGYGSGTHCADVQVSSEAIAQQAPEINKIPVECNTDVLRNFYAPYYRSISQPPSWLRRWRRKVKKLFGSN